MAHQKSLMQSIINNILDDDYEDDVFEDDATNHLYSSFQDSNDISQQGNLHAQQSPVPHDALHEDPVQAETDRGLPMKPPKKQIEKSKWKETSGWLFY